jgi:hypothetical protein
VILHELLEPAKQVYPDIGGGVGLPGEGVAMTGKLGVEGRGQGESVSRNDFRKQPEAFEYK